MFKASLYLLGLNGILELIKRYSTNPSYTITLSIAQVFILLCGAYCLWYDRNVNKQLKKHLQLLRNRLDVLRYKEITPLVQAELDLNFAYRMKIITQLNNPKYYRKHLYYFNLRIKQTSMYYILIKDF